MSDTLVVGDPLCSLQEKNLSMILTVISFKLSSGKETKWIEAEKLRDVTVKGCDQDGKYIWDGSSYVAADLPRKELYSNSTRN